MIFILLKNSIPLLDDSKLHNESVYIDTPAYRDEPILYLYHPLQFKSLSTNPHITLYDVINNPTIKILL